MRGAFVVFVLATLSRPAVGQVRFYTDGTRIADALGDATFDKLQNGDPLQDYQEDGLRLRIDDVAFATFPAPGLNQLPIFYPNGGANEQIDIARIDESALQVIEMNVSHGFGGETVFLWIQAYLHDELVDQFNADVGTGALVGLEGDFDQVKIASYASALIRNLRDPAEQNAAALDNVVFGTPEPSALLLLGLGGLTSLRRRG